MFTFDADEVETDIHSTMKGADNRQIDRLLVSFSAADSRTRICRTLTVSRVYEENDESAMVFLGKPEICLRVDDWEANTTGGIKKAELSRGRFRFVLTLKAAKIFEDAETIITFDIDDDVFETVSNDLNDMFADQKYYTGT
ncbi:MAG TPA: hypothetical protein VFE62_01475 [Gemmataceae bacterium]|nr:hypothetical protein [Gemmataceae bacterium]